ncbi:unnamed protein product [Orchesella dallaii]|uniref:Uncharacterized protein n=1 Tax=Orchesella dallaii TaxID=48710 RepID=A0ABP1S665_9HEXA
MENVQMRKFSWLLVMGSIIVCVSRQCMFALKFAPWYDRYGKLISSSATLGFWKPNNVTTPQYVSIILGTFGIIFESIMINYWNFCQVFHFFCVLTIWIVFDKLNKTWKCGYLSIHQLPQVKMQQLFCICKLML